MKKDKIIVDKRTAKPRREGSEVLCWTCGKMGILRYKRHISYFYPYYTSTPPIEKRKAKGIMYLSEAEEKYGLKAARKQFEDLVRDRNISDTEKEIAKEEYDLLKKKVTKDAYAIRYRSDRFYPVVYHYSHNKYLEEKEQCKKGLRKRASGMICHYYKPI